MPMRKPSSMTTLQYLLSSEDYQMNKTEWAAELRTLSADNHDVKLNASECEEIASLLTTEEAPVNGEQS